MSMHPILQSHTNNLALIIGNGINRYGCASDKNSWAQLLANLAENHLPSSPDRPEGVSPTEFFDVLELNASTPSLQKEFCNLMDKWKPFDHHAYITEWSERNSVPILTTNFDTTLSKACFLKPRRTIKGKFTAYYPWETYYGRGPVDDPKDSFAIWHINGMERYRQSIRLGLTHYLGSAQRARAWLHRGGEARLFSGKSHDAWRGAKTWLRMIFGSKLLIFGLDLGQDEVFLRWLLLERARYFRKFPDRKRMAWYVEKEADQDSGKKFFLNSVGIETVAVPDDEDIYGERVWK